MTIGGMSGTLARPADVSLSAVASKGRGLAAALLTALAMHLVLLAQPGVRASSYVEPVEPAVMIVRTLAPPLLTPASPAATQEATRAPLTPIEEPPRPSVESNRQEAARAAPAPAPARRPQPVAVPNSEPPPLDRAVQPPTPLAEPRPAAAALPAAPDYAFGVRLDPGPRPLEDIEPEYPDPVHLREGTVVLRLLISDTGHVDNVAVVRSEPRGIFEEAALEAFGKARFSPGLAGGMPVKSQITVEVQFMPINRGARVSGRTY